jgi:hypothetical protein
LHQQLRQFATNGSLGGDSGGALFTGSDVVRHQIVIGLGKLAAHERIDHLPIRAHAAIRPLRGSAIAGSPSHTRSDVANEPLTSSAGEQG